MIHKITLFVASLLFTATIFASPQIQHWETSNGARVYFVAAPELPMLDISVVFDGGAARDGALPGTALLTSAILNEGAGDLDTDQIAAKFAGIGAKFGASAERDMALVSLRTLTAEPVLETALATFTTVLTEPTFPQDSFERLKKQVLIGLLAEKQSPAALASRAFYKNLFNEHPYSTMPSGEESSVTNITLDDLKAFYQQYYVTKNAVIVLVGDIEVDKAKAIAEQAVAGLNEGEAAKEIKPVMVLEKAVTKKIEHPSSQTHILMGQPGINRTDPDYFALYVGNHILGGSGLVSILSNEIREKRGLSYSVYSYFRPMRQLGPYQFGLQTRNEQAAEALEVMRNTLIDFIKDGPTEDELNAAKQNITGGFALRVDSNSKIANYLAMIGFYDLPLDYLDTFKDEVNSITTMQIKEAFARRIQPEKMLTVMVGGEAQ
ncbi:peptidase M16 [Methylophaga sp. 42_25_T18]|nr:peptidase M16 [Methylophaga sp. 42_25_T18]OUR86366.1 peptidase M16 [Methylophaga sp. 42_8_T64]